MYKRQLSIPLFSLVWTLFASCSGNRVNSTLCLVDSLLDESPEIAADMLNQIRDSFTTASTADQMYYRLLSVKALDKQDAAIQDTSEILSLLHYYQHNPQTGLLPTAYYYAGRMYYELNEMPQSLEYFQQAVESIKDSTYKHWRLREVCYSQMGYIFYYQRLYDEAKSMFQKSIDCAKEINDSSGIAYGLRDVSTIYSDQREYDKAINKLYEAKSYMKNSKDIRLMLAMDSYLADCYSQIGKLDSALKLIRPVVANISRMDSSAVYSNIANIMYTKGNMDSALYYFHKLETVGNLYGKANAYKHLLESCLSKIGDPEALTYYQEYRKYTDSTNRIAITESVARTNSLYHIHKKEKENHRLERANNRLWISVFLLVALVTTIALITISLYQLFKRRQTELASRNQILERIKEENHRKSEEYIKENNLKIQQLEEQLRSLHSEKIELQKRLEREKERLISSNRMAEIGIEERNLAVKSMMDSDIYRELMNLQENQHPSSEQWKRLEAGINLEFDRFADKLRSICKLSEIEFRVSLLIKLGFEPTRIGHILNTSGANISTTRSRLYRKVFGKKGGAKDWDEFIRSV